ncbi:MULTISPECIES: hypothetical protein [Lactobacillaceae]|uniref:hypothetical protein n=1 Tax=Lactobacillaceae TaxID=33958 RepID=UPI001456C3AB|nr:hypothetical protein [Lactobacillus sp. HBUAS51381]NLR09454.1 hypothetical protein [Lactobacillus sp. HBUAS51381]
MLKDKCLPAIANPINQEDIHRFTDLIDENPWLIPATVMLEIIPITVVAHGFWKNRQLKKQLQIERERTKQLQINRFRPSHHDGQPRPLAEHLHGPFHH